MFSTAQLISALNKARLVCDGKFFPNKLLTQSGNYFLLVPKSTVGSDYAVSFKALQYIGRNAKLDGGEATVVLINSDEDVMAFASLCEVAINLLEHAPRAGDLGLYYWLNSKLEYASPKLAPPKKNGKYKMAK